MKEVAHGIDEDAPGLSPMQRLRQAVRSERQIETVLKGVSRHAAKTLRKALRVTEIATTRDLRTTRYGVPSRVCPFDLSSCRHPITIEQNKNIYKCLDRTRRLKVSIGPKPLGKRDPIGRNRSHLLSCSAGLPAGACLRTIILTMLVVALAARTNLTSPSVPRRWRRIPAPHRRSYGAPVASHGPAAKHCAAPRARRRCAGIRRRCGRRRAPGRIAPC